MTWGELSAVSSIIAAGTGVVGWLARLLHKVKTNDLRHIDDKIDNMTMLMNLSLENDKRIEGKLDGHIAWHLTKQ